MHGNILDAALAARGRRRTEHRRPTAMRDIRRVESTGTLPRARKVDQSAPESPADASSRADCHESELHRSGTRARRRGRERRRTDSAATGPLGQNCAASTEPVARRQPEIRPRAGSPEWAILRCQSALHFPSSPLIFEIDMIQTRPTGRVECSHRRSLVRCGHQTEDHRGRTSGNHNKTPRYNAALS